ncbi:MAG: NUDIX domain-containing protein [Patescibacteria group bacterium]
METRTRIAGIIIQNGKILMLKGKGYKELWTPGGKIKEGENDEECLKRELKEEIGVNLVNLKFFGKYFSDNFYNRNIALDNIVYIATINGDMRPDNEIENFVWFSKEDFETKKYPMITVTEKEIIPDLIKAKIW